MLKKLLDKKTKLAVIGLGYVGIPLAVAFSQRMDVIGFDLNKEKINLYRNGIDPTKEVGNNVIKKTSIYFTSNEEDLAEASFYIIAVPTPVKKDKTPDLVSVFSASGIVGRNMKKGAIIVYESTVYPGVTEEECVPVLEKESGLKCGDDFKVGYSPERINPCDKDHMLATVIKVVSGMDEETLNIVAGVYEQVVSAGVYRAESIKVAEAAKVIENSQRDINIAFMNELAIIFHKMGIDTKSVMEAAGTKWNFLKFQPGLVGGHCIGVDPYYLTHKAAQLGYHSQVILAGRRINDDMGRYVAENVVKLLIKAGKSIKKSNVAILGFAFKENCQDTRNTKVIDIINELREYGIEPVVTDDVADKAEAERLYGINLVSMENVTGMDAIVVCVKHKIYEELDQNSIGKMYAKNTRLLFDLKGIFDKKEYEDNGYRYWRL